MGQQLGALPDQQPVRVTLSQSVAKRLVGDTSLTNNQKQPMNAMKPVKAGEPVKAVEPVKAPVRAKKDLVDSRERNHKVAKLKNLASEEEGKEPMSIEKIEEYWRKLYDSVNESYSKRSCINERCLLEALETVEKLLQVGEGKTCGRTGQSMLQCYLRHRNNTLCCSSQLVDFHRCLHEATLQKFS